MENTTQEKFDERITDVCKNEENMLVGLDGPEEKKAPVLERAAQKVKSAACAVGARTIVVICSVLLIGVAVILNYVLASGGDIIENFEPVGNVSQDGDASKDEDTYFVSSILSREQARDEAIEVLKTVVNNEAALEEAKEAALTDIARIAGEIETEANIETLIKSKGFEECIAVVTGSNANVIVKSDGLLQNELSQIKEIVYEQAGIDPVNIKIVEKK